MHAGEHAREKMRVNSLHIFSCIILRYVFYGKGEVSGENKEFVRIQ
jgi:hypothetical protein